MRDQVNHFTKHEDMVDAVVTITFLGTGIWAAIDLWLNYLP